MTLRRGSQALLVAAALPRIDTAHAVGVASPTTSEVVVRTPRIPGLELRIPAGSSVRDPLGEPVTEVSITAIPVDRPPFPLPQGVIVPLYFTVQPGRSYVFPAGARLIYPNYTHEAPGRRMDFWNYDAQQKGWYIYGQGTVTADGSQVVPDPGVVIYEFTGAMISVPGLNPPPTGPAPGSAGGGAVGGLPPEGASGPPPPPSPAPPSRPPAPPASSTPPRSTGRDGDPVDLGTGLFVLERTDLVLPDVLPLALTRTYRPGDTEARPFGIGTTFGYGMFLWSAQQYQQADLILPDGGRVHYLRTSPGTGFTDAVFEHTATPTVFYKSQLAWNGAGWDLTLRDGTVYVFGENAPLQAIRDRYGNATTLTWSNTNAFGNGFGTITRVTSPHGRWLAFTYDASNRITQAQDNTGRTVGYSYDGSGRLWQVTDPAGGVTEYTYDASHRLLTIKDAKGTVFLTNQYDAGGRVSLQTQADGTTYQFAYTTDAGGKITQTDVTDPRGNVRRVTFNADGYSLSDTLAVGRPEQQAATYERQAGSNLLTAATDPLGRRTTFTYDTLANLTSVTALAGTAGAVTASATYEPTFNKVASTTDPLGHTTSYRYDVQGNLTTVTDALGHQTTLAYNAAGQPLSVTDALGNTTHLAYDLGDLVSMTDPLGNTVTGFTDGAGRATTMTNAVGATTRAAYDAVN